ncbi:unnamed protein product [Arctia plantaginis]|uniref:Gustatory receptor n=1 Tax=Arctia plantaginis TaxID=874455 RepID=A0A8S1A9G7_ARCPL|nr:unnamed protein product [Arctia plantaginis]
MFDTKMQRYGDDSEKITSLVYVVLAMWKLPFGLFGNSSIVKIIMDADKALENLGEKVDYNRDALSASSIFVGLVIVQLLRLFSIWLILKNLNINIPAARVYQAVFSDTLALIVTSFYCYFLSVLRNRYRYANKVLAEINSHKAWEYKIFVRGRMPTNMHKAENLQDRLISEKIKSCAKIYGMFYKVVVGVNDVFGFILLMTTLVSLIYVILYLFYFLEATSAGLFHDLPKYIDFCIYVFWQAAYGIAIVFLIVLFCEGVMREARQTSYILHEIMSSDFSPTVTSEVSL